MTIVGQTGAGIQTSGSDGVVKITGGTISSPRSFVVSGSSNLEFATVGSGLQYDFPSTSTTLVGTDTAQSISNKNIIHLVSQDPLPSTISITGSIAVSSSGATEKLYFHDGSAWKEVSFV